MDHQVGGYFLWPYLDVSFCIDWCHLLKICIWCKCSSDERCDPDRKCSINICTEAAWTVEKNTELASSCGKKFIDPFSPAHPWAMAWRTIFTCFCKSLMYSSIFLWLSISVKMLLKKVRYFSQLYLTYHHLDRIQTHMSISDFQFYVERASRQLKCRTPTEPGNAKLLKIEWFLPHLPKCIRDKIQHFWMELLKLDISKDSEELTAADADAFKKWPHSGRLFITTLNTEQALT